VLQITPALNCYIVLEKCHRITPYLISTPYQLPLPVGEGWGEGNLMIKNTIQRTKNQRFKAFTGYAAAV
jgi:hypothetical protein